MNVDPAVPPHDLRRLADLRHAMRDYLAWAEERAREHDTTPAHFQLLLAVRADEHPEGPSIGELADTLVSRHHSVVGLVDRAQKAGLVARRRDDERAAVVRVQLTDAGRALVDELAALHVAELVDRAPAMTALWTSIGARGSRR